MARRQASDLASGPPPIAVASAETSETPFGLVWVAASTRGVVSIQLGGNEPSFESTLPKLADEQVDLRATIAEAAVQQIEEYLTGRRQMFDLPLDLSPLTDFQRDVLDLVWHIPYGKVRSYGSIAVELGQPGAARAVGRANATNPLPLVIPCHRVIGSDGRLHGYGGGGGIATKAWLLRLEGSYLL